MEVLERSGLNLVYMDPVCFMRCGLFQLVNENLLTPFN
jgi:hypothetical protein